MTRLARGLSALTVAAVALGCAGAEPSPPVEAGDATAPAVRIMPLGDSITSSYDGGLSYRHCLWYRLREAGFEVDFVGSLSGVHLGQPARTDFDQDHEGHWAWSVADVVPLIDQWARAARPDIALVHLGTNDLALRRPLGDIVDDLERVVVTLREVNPQVDVFLAEIIPATYPLPIPDLNRAIRGLASRLDTHGARAVAVDQFSGFDPQADTFDGVHPNEAGDHKLCEGWYAALVESDALRR